MPLKIYPGHMSSPYLEERTHITAYDNGEAKLKTAVKPNLNPSFKKCEAKLKTIARQ